MNLYFTIDWRTPPDSIELVDSTGRTFRIINLGTPDRHCATCQCNKFPATPPQPENPRSRSWHENALTAPPK